MIRFLLVQLLMLFVQNSLSCMEQTACENQDLSISCPNRNRIKIIRANYGRRDSKICGLQTNFKSSEICSADKAFNIVVARCNKKRSCTINANNGEFGDPCEGIDKYLYVKHKCLMEQKTEEVCENDQITIVCSNEKKVRIKKVFYGRENEVTCGNVPNFSSPCSAAGAVGRVINICKGKQSCTVKAGSEVFGDPCLGIIKYMRITYTCDENCRKITKH